MPTPGRSYHRGGAAAKRVPLRYPVFGLSIVTLAVIAALIWNYATVRRPVSAAAVAQRTQKPLARRHAFFAPVAGRLRDIANWGRTGAVILGNADELNARFMPVLEQCPQIHSISVAGDTDLNYTLMRGADFWNIRIAYPSAAKGAPAARWQRVDPEGRVTAEWTDENRINPYSLGWYVGAVAGPGNDIYWTEPHRLFEGAETAVSAAVGWQVNSRRYAAAVHLLTRDIDRLGQETGLGDTVRFFLYSGRRVRIDLTPAEGFFPESGQTAKSLGLNLPEDPLLAVALGPDRREQSSGRPYSFKLNGATWWAHLSPFEDARSRQGVGVVVSEDALIGEILIRRYLLASMLLGVLWIGLAAYARATHRHRQAADSQI